MNLNTIDDLLHKLRLACIRSEWRAAEAIVFDAVAWYVGTGRASLEWLRALLQTDLDALVTDVMKADDHSIQGTVNFITQYITK